MTLFLVVCILRYTPLTLFLIVCILRYTPLTVPDCVHTQIHPTHSNLRRSLKMRYTATLWRTRPMQNLQISIQFNIGSGNEIILCYVQRDLRKMYNHYSLQRSEKPQMVCTSQTEHNLHTNPDWVF